MVPMSARRVTIPVLARELGLGVGTVSSALNGRGRVAEATRQKVLEHAKARGYQPNAAARSLRTGAKGAIELHLPRRARHLSFYTDFAFGVVDAATENGRDVLLSTGDQPHTQGALGIDGAVFIDYEAGSTRLAELVGSGVPVVVGDGVPDGAPHPTREVNVDYAQVLRQVLSAATAAGARHPLLVAPDTTLDSAWRDDLLSDFDEICRECDVDGDVITFPVDAGDPHLLEVIRAVLDEGAARTRPAPDTLIFGGQRLAGVVCSSLGLGRPGSTVPWVASLAADPFSEIPSPVITAVDMRPRAFGRRCGQALVESLGPEAGPDHVAGAAEVEDWPIRIDWAEHWAQGSPAGTITDAPASDRVL